MRFNELPLLPSLLDAVEKEGYQQPTPIQEQAIPSILEGHDVLGCAQTGTGKTAAFALPILHHLTSTPAPAEQRGRIRTLVLTPTRELAAQVGESFSVYGRNSQTRTVVIFGGVGQGNQERELRRGPQILVATPGRLLDLINQRIISLAHVEVFVLDEADRMLDMGFIHDIRKVVALLPAQRQSLFFSATMPAEIRKLADTILRPDPVFVAVDPPASTVELIEQQLCFVEKKEKLGLLTHFVKQPWVHRALVFSRTKHGADKIVRQLVKSGIKALAIHGNKSQNARTRALDGFKAGTTDVLVATDIAARGIDVEDISHVINFDLPNEPETYVHRIGRTGRAGTSGVAIAFCGEDERPYLKDIERLIQVHIPRLEGHPNKSPIPAPEPTDLNPRGRQGTRPVQQQTSNRSRQRGRGGPGRGARNPVRSHSRG
jgi:ATP-dependent RNA helicase RhlE